MSNLAKYQTGAIIVWLSILVASVLILAGTPYFIQMLPVLSGGIVWFVVIVPGALLRERGTRPS